MILLDIDRSASILASAGATTQRLTLCLPPTGGGPVLVDAAGTVFDPWEVELLWWPPETEAVLRRGGYLSGRPPEQEPWCNCAD